MAVRTTGPRHNIMDRPDGPRCPCRKLKPAHIDIEVQSAQNGRDDDMAVGPDGARDWRVFA